MKYKNISIKSDQQTLTIGEEFPFWSQQKGIANNEFFYDGENLTLEIKTADSYEKYYVLAFDLLAQISNNNLHHPNTAPTSHKSELKFQRSLNSSTFQKHLTKQVITYALR